MDIPETGDITVDSVLRTIGVVYLVLTAILLVLPKDSPWAKILAIFAADLRNLLAAKPEIEVPDLMPRTARRRSRTVPD